jgi:hypothetical protein
MPTLRQQVDSFCKSAGAKVDSSDKLRQQVADLKAELKKLKETHKNALKAEKTKAKTRKLTEEEKGQQKREKAVTKELAKAAKAPKASAAPKQVVAMNPLPPSPVVTSAGRRTRRRL